MKETRSIYSLVALAVLLGVYDLLREWRNFSTVEALITVLILLLIWMLGYWLLARYVFKSEDEENARPKGKSFVDKFGEAFHSSELIIQSKIQQFKGRARDSVNGSAMDNTPVAELSSTAAREEKAEAVPAKLMVMKKTAADPLETLNTGKRARLHKILAASCRGQGISSAAILTFNAVVLASMPVDIGGKQSANAVSASLFILGTKMAKAVGREKLDQLVVSGMNGFVYFQNILDDVFLMLIVEKATLIGGVIREAHRCAEGACEVLRD